MHRAWIAAIALAACSPWALPAQHLIPVGAKLPEPPTLPEPAPLPMMSPPPATEQGPPLTPPPDVTQPLVKPIEPPNPVEAPIEEPKPETTPTVPERVRGELPKTWGADEYLLWWIKRGPALPAIATTGLDGASPVIGGESVNVLHQGPIDRAERSGARFAWGWAFGDEKTIGMEIVYFFLGTRTDSVRFGHSGVTPDTLGRPFVNAMTGAEDALLVGAFGESRGFVEAAVSSRMTGWEVNGVGHLLDTTHFEVDALFGWRYVLLNEGLRINSLSTPVIGTSGDMLPDFLMVADQIDASSRFHGGQVGLKTNWRRGGLFLEMTGKVAFGQTNEVVRSHGVSAMVGGDVPPVVSPGGFFGQKSNGGRFTDNVFAYVPEGSVRLGFHFTDHSRFFVGYNFLYISDVVRPEDHVERTINSNQVPLVNFPTIAGGPRRPAFELRHTDFWAQGLMIGTELRY